MRDVVARIGAVTIFAMAGLHTSGSPGVRANVSPVPVGMLAREGNAFGIGVGLPFGRIVAAQLDALCGAAVAEGVSDVHPSPERVLVFPVRDGNSGAALLDAANKLGLITAAEDVRLVIDVCPGSPACGNASTDTRGDAARLVEAFNGYLSGYSLHVSGCEKGCARRAKADLTLVARGGYYDIIRGGRPGDPIAIEGVKWDHIGSAISRFIMEPAS